MGQTLSHGVYLPNEGERNCYTGLASNWQILNTAVGAIAEKAPLVHTHTVSQITDFPAYGNAAGTICEGNDSRLSDARTPVAHTHTKSDVTDLLNSNFIPSANNSYDLGSSSYQWNNLYAKKVNTQSVNGINPGALSLPGAYQDISDQIKNPSGQLNAIDLNGGSNTWVSDVDCYLYFYIPNNKFTWIRIFWPPTLVRCGQTFVPVPNESSDYSGFLPVPANTTVIIQIKGTRAPVFRRSACLGNV